MKPLLEERALVCSAKPFAVDDGEKPLRLVQKLSEHDANTLRHDHFVLRRPVQTLGQNLRLSRRHERLCHPDKNIL